MERKLLWICSLFLFFKLINSVPVNVALNKVISAEISCGMFSRTGVEEFFGHSQVFLQPINRKLETCTNSTFPASNMVDNSSTTKWQSASRTILIERGFGISSKTAEIIVTLDLKQEYNIQKITIGMGDSKRPKQIALLKGTVSNVYVPWVNRVTNEFECSTIFSRSVLHSPVATGSVMCSSYGSLMAASFEKLLFDFSTVSASLSTWKNTRYIQMKFYNMDLTLGINAVRFHHYTINDIEVLAECNCGGQHVGCNISSTTGQYECVCGGNTQGQYCQECKPFYNQKPYTQGVPCEACNCFGHADTCRYDAATDRLNFSLNTQGVYSGGGNCIGCKDNTSGINCERCVHYFFRPVDVPQSHQNACLPCECNSHGSVSSIFSGQVGDCLTNSNVTLPPQLINMKPGDCFCKSNVESSKCDQCKPGFFNLTSNNPSGCQACLCNTVGTVNGSNICTANSTGQCPCKQFTMNRQCGACMHGYYGMTANNTQGCLSCGCDVGGAQNGVCNPVSGQCLCRPNVVGRQCTGPATNYYYPDLHFISVEAEHISDIGKWARQTPGYSGFGYALIQSGVVHNTELLFPGASSISGEVTLQFYYTSDAVVSVNVTLTPAVNGALKLSLPVCSNPWCSVESAPITMTRGALYSINIRADKGFKLDRIVALPKEFLNTTALLGSQSTTFQSTCDVKKNDMKLNSTNEALCLASVFSVTSYYLNGSLPCNCHPQGSYNQSCAAYGGQCPCKPGVGGRRCDTCQPEFYNLNNTGCSACKCAGAEKVCNLRTGQCPCPPNVVGQQCDLCAANHWNWNMSTGCQTCNCSTIGSMNLQCNLTTGVCPCKMGIGGNNCEGCKDEFAGYNPLGCAPCNCDMAGSMSTVCNKTTFQCDCKNNSRGQSCNTCAAGTFYNSPSHSTGCLDCVCMGVSNVCGSTNQRLKSTHLALVNSTNNQSEFSLSTLAQTLSIVPTYVIFNNTSPVLEAPFSNGATAYWTSKTNINFKGNMLGIYENNITFTVQWTSSDTTGTALTNVGVYIVGRKNSQLMIPIAAVVKDTVTTVSVQVTEVSVVTSTKSAVTRQQLLLALTDVQSLYIPATFYTRGHTSRLFSVSYSMASTLGTGGLSVGVEQCTCGKEYTGTSCQNCAVGYKRANVTSHAFLGVCVACECNGHASECDPNTGECINCLHNTAGPHCQVCSTGHYGDATKGLSTDCTTCPCLSPRVANTTCNMTAGKPVCLYCAEGYTGDLCDSCQPFYYGNPEVPNVGQCSRCNCSGNTNQCNNKTGECVSCGFNSTGFNCDTCKDNWYGNASAQNCQECSCDMRASNSSICEHQTGQCSCFPGVGSRTCDHCLPNYYGYTNASIFGCVPCECNAGGSTSQQCNDQGICPCNSIAGGVKCDFCAVGYFGLPHKPCKACQCNTTGTANISAHCEREFGQCGCKPGVVGRQCDKCDRLYTGFSNTGCTQCGVCQDSLGNDTLKMKERWTQYWNQSQDVGAVQIQDNTLQNLTKEINQTSSLLGVSSNRLNELTSTVNRLNAQESSYNNTVNRFLDRVITVLSNAMVQVNQSIDENERIKLLQAAAINASTSVGLLNASSAANLLILQNFATQSQQLVATSLVQGVGKVNVSFTSELETALIEMNHTLATTARAQALAEQVRTQEKEIVAIRNATVQAQQDFNSLKQPLAVLMANTQSIRNVLKSVWQNVHTTEANRAYIDGLLNETDAMTKLSIGLLEESQKSFDTGSKMFLDTKTIIDGMANGTILPINTTVDLSKVPSFNQGADYLDQVEIPPLNQSLRNFSQIDLPRLRHYVLTLTQQATEINRAYKTVEPTGIQAVNAIKTYQSVISSLTVAHTLSVAANETMTQALAELQSVSVTDLQQQALKMVTTAGQLMANVSSYDNTATTLQQQLNVANNSLTSTINVWQGLSSHITSINAAAAGLSTVANNPTLQNEITSGMTSVAVAINSANILAGQAVPIEQAVTVQEGQLALIQETVKNATAMQQQVNTDLFAFTPKLNEVKRTIDLTNNTYIASSSIKARIEARILLVEQKVRRAKELLVKMEQPVSFKSGAYERLSSPKAATPNMLYNEIKFDFKYDLEPQGILFFTENNATKEKLLVQMTGGKLVFEFSNVDKTIQAISPVLLCRGCWFRVQATRYGIDGQLTVTKLSTGGTAVTHIRGDSTLHNQFTLNSDVFVAGLPPGYPVTKVNAGTHLEGCIYELTFDGFTIPLWQNILHKNSKAQCCTPPTELQGPATVANALTFTGFGSYAKVNLSMPVQNSHIAMQFRTFTPDGVLLLADSPGVVAYYALVIQGGRVGLMANAGGQALNLRTDKTYTDGSWYQLTAQFNQSYALLHLEKHDNGTNWLTSEVKSQAHAVNLATLVAPQFTMAGQNPNTTTSFGPATRNFGGCIQSVQHNTGASLTLSPVSLGVLSSVGVKNNMCYQQVLSGIGVTSTQGYVTLNSIASPMTYLEFDVLTYQPNGILLFAELSGNPPTTFLYVAMYHGDILVMFNQGSGIQPPLRSRGLYLANGLLHTVTLDFRFQNSPRLTVSGQRHYGALSMSPGMTIHNNKLYALGVPPSITLDTKEIPVPHSMIGGIRNIKVNTQLVNHLQNLDLTLHKDGYLSGLPAPPASAPPLPYITTPAPPTQPTPTCAPTSQFSMSSVGVRFGDQKLSYMAFTVNEVQLFLNSFVIRVEFRAVQPNGIILYMSSTILNAQYYLCLYMQAGYLKFSMQTNSTSSRTTQVTKSITSKNTYDDGKWWKVDAIRMNDFMAMVVTGTPDYINNGQPSGPVTSLIIASPLYIGGVSPQHAGTPFTLSTDIGVGTSSFHGCVKKVEVVHTNTQFVNLDFTAPLSAVGTSKCYAQVNPGAYLNATQAYIKVEDAMTKLFNVIPTFEMSIEFRSSGINGTLAVAYQSQARFFLIDIINGQISFLVGNAQLVTAPLLGKSSTLDIGFGLCSGQLHNLTVRIDTTRLMFNFDNKGWETITYPNNFSPPQINNVAVYAGGYKDPLWAFPAPVSRESFHGCLQTVAINKKEYNLVASTDKLAVIAGCPA